MHASSKTWQIKQYTALYKVRIFWIRKKYAGIQRSPNNKVSKFTSIQSLKLNNMYYHISHLRKLKQMEPQCTFIFMIQHYFPILLKVDKHEIDRKKCEQVNIQLTDDYKHMMTDFSHL